MKIKRKRQVAVARAVAEALECRRLLTGTGLIDVQFNVTGDAAYTNPVQVGPAVVGSAGDEWNNIRAAYFFNGETASPIESTNLALFDSGGNTTNVTLSYAAQFATQPASGPVSPFAGTPYQNLMNAYFTVDSQFGGTSTPGVVVFQGLTPNGNYALYLYSDGDANGRETKFTVGGVPETASFNTEESIFVNDANYVEFNAMADSMGELVISFDAGNGSAEGDFNGIQLQNAVLPAPTPLTPVNGQTDQSLMPTFSWSAVSGATQYDVVYATDESDLPTATDSTLGPTAIEASSNTTSYRPTTALSANTEYFWEVIGESAGLPGTYSAISNFTTGNPTIGLSGTTATVVGTNGDDTDSVSVSDGQVLLTVDGQTQGFQSSLVGQINITLGNGNDTLSTAADVTAVSVLGGTGNSSVIAGSADATVHSGSGNDTIVASGKASLIKANGGKDDLVAEAKLETIHGGSGLDTIDPLKGGDSLRGGTGTNFFLDAGATHPNTVNGGTGFSFAEYNPADVMSNIFEIIDPPAPVSGGVNIPANVSQDAAATDPLVGGPLDSSNSVTASVVDGELKVSGTSIADVISVTLNGAGTKLKVVGNGEKVGQFALADLTGIRVNGGPGADSITIGATVTLPATLLGNGGADTLVGGGGDNVLLGGPGGDSLVGGAGTNLLVPDTNTSFIGAPAGNDTLDGGAGFSIADFSRRTDSLVLSNDGAPDSGDTGEGETDDIMSNVSAIWGGTGGNTITGATGGEFLSGGAGANSVHGGGVNDLLVGGGGNDTVIVAAEPVSLYLINGEPNEYGGVSEPSEDVLQLDSMDTELM